MPSGNIWDNSQTILSDRSGANYAQAFGSIGNSLTDGVNQYFKNKQDRDILSSSIEGRIKADPTIAQLADPALIKKFQDQNATLSDLQRLSGMMETASTIKQQNANVQLKNQEAQSQIQYRDAQTQQMIAEMQRTKQEEAALQYALDPSGGMMGGAPAGGQLPPGMEQSIMSNAAAQGMPPGQGNPQDQLDPMQQVASNPTARYARAGGGDPRTAASLMKDEPFVPSAVDLPGGGRMLMTSRNSAVPDPADRVSAGGASGVKYNSTQKFISDYKAAMNSGDFVTAQAIAFQLGARDVTGSGMPRVEQLPGYAEALAAQGKLSPAVISKSADGNFKSVADVVAALKAGKIDRLTARKILATQFKITD